MHSMPWKRCVIIEGRRFQTLLTIDLWMVQPRLLHGTQLQGIVRGAGSRVAAVDVT